MKDNNPIKTGIAVMEAKIDKNLTKLEQLGSDLEYFETLKETEIIKAKKLVTETEILQRLNINSDLREAINLLENCK